MKVTIKYTSECKKKVFVETGKVIGEVMVEIDTTTLTNEQRVLLLDYTTGVNDNMNERSLKFYANEYVSDVMKLISKQDERLIAALKEARAQADEMNKNVVVLNALPCRRVNEAFAVDVAAATWQLNYGEYHVKIEKRRVFSEEYAKIAEATRDDILSMINVFNEELKSRVADAIISQREETRKVLVELQERKECEERKKQEIQDKLNETERKRKAWIEANGSSYLKNLLHEGMRWSGIFFKEYEAAELERINSATGLDCHIYNEDDYKNDEDDNTYDVQEYELSDVTPSETMMDSYLRMKKVEGFVSAKMVKVTHENYGEEQWIKKFLVAKFKTELYTYEVKISKPQNK